MTMIAGLVLFITFFIFLIIGLPIALAIILSSIITLLLILPFDVTIVTAAQRMVTGIDDFTMLAIPLFVLAGIIMNNGGIAFRLVNFAKVLVGRLPGSLAHTNIVGNKKEYSAAANIASAPSGLLIPPSSLLIVYSLVSGGTSIAALFIAGYIPGILWGIACMIVAYVMAKKQGYKVSEKISWKDRLFLTLDALPSLFLIVVVIGGIVGGIFTATEGAAVAVLYSVVLSLIYKSLKIKQLSNVIKETAEISGMILFLITASALFSLVMSYTGLPEAISNGIISMTDNPIALLLLINVILLVIGTFMDITPAVLIFTPIFLPISEVLGLDPIHFGIIIAFNLCIGNITPPVGSALFVGASVGGVRVESVFKYLIPYFVALIILMLIITFIPQLSLFLPKLLGL